MYYNSEQGKIRFDSKDEFDAWFKLYEGENILYHAFGEIEPCEYPCVMTYVLVKNVNYDIEGIDRDDIYYCFIYKRNLVDHENV